MNVIKKKTLFKRYQVRFNYWILEVSSDDILNETIFARPN